LGSLPSKFGEYISFEDLKNGVVGKSGKQKTENEVV
jgi:hypothetical protein